MDFGFQFRISKIYRLVDLKAFLNFQMDSWKGYTIEGILLLLILLCHI